MKLHYIVRRFIGAKPQLVTVARFDFYRHSQSPHSVFTMVYSSIPSSRGNSKYPWVGVKVRLSAKGAKPEAPEALRLNAEGAKIEAPYRHRGGGV